MKELSSVEKNFILKAIRERKRLDGRQAYDVRRMKIQFGVDSGCCVVDLGDTKVILILRCGDAKVCGNGERRVRVVIMSA